MTMGYMYLTNAILFITVSNYQELLETELMYVTDLEQAATYITYMRDSKEAEEADIRSAHLFRNFFLSHFCLFRNLFLSHFHLFLKEPIFVTFSSFQDAWRLERRERPNDIWKPWEHLWVAPRVSLYISSTKCIFGFGSYSWWTTTTSSISMQYIWVQKYIKDARCSYLKSYKECN